MVVVSLGVEGVICEEQEGRVNVYITLLLHFVRVWGLTATVLTPWGRENSEMSSHTPMSTLIPTVAFPSPFSCLKERGEKVAKK
jgi:hypothetical protein